MGWEQRGTHMYYYRKARVGIYVRSIYLGRGDLARVCSEHDQDRQRIRSAEREAFNDFRVSEARIDRCLEAQRRMIMSAVDKALRSAGYHKHKGQWRRRRHET